MRRREEEERCRGDVEVERWRGGEEERNRLIRRGGEEGRPRGGGEDGRRRGRQCVR